MQKNQAFKLFTVIAEIASSAKMVIAYHYYIAFGKNIADGFMLILKAIISGESA